MSFFPGNYDRGALAASGGGRYFKPEDGKNKVRICSDAIFGFVYWTEDNKPKRSFDHPGSNSPDMRKGDENKAEQVKPFLAMVVWDYATQAVLIWEITQKTIMQGLDDLYGNEDWGDPKNYDLTITRTGEKFKTTYSLVPSNLKPVGKDIAAAVKDTPVNLAALYSGENPFDPNVVAEMPPAEDSKAWKTFQDLLARSGGDEEKIKQATEWALQKMPAREAEIYMALDIPF